MRNNDNRDALVGGLVMVVVAALFAFSYGGKDLSAQANVGSYPVTAVFNRVDGLFEGDEVRLGGIRIGTVGAQRLDDNFRAVVTLNIANAVKLPTDSAAAIHTDGLFGSKFVVMEPGVEEKNLQAGDDIEYTQGAVIVGELLNLIIEEGRARKGQNNPEQANTPQEQGN
ncbi:MlaD family protein [Magnetovibrio sp.]|uniref:MlaD family protein n=1 Tax=Magnetovibrio sp. TaxID=2024836 RepID=UPI002F93D8B6